MSETNGRSIWKSGKVVSFLVVAVTCLLIMINEGLEHYQIQKTINSEAEQHYQQGIDLQAAGKLSEAKAAFEQIVQQLPTSGSVSASKQKLAEVNDAIERAHEDGRRLTEDWANSKLNGISSDSDGLVTHTWLSGAQSSNRSHSHDTVKAQVLDACKIRLTLNSFTHRQLTGQSDSDETHSDICDINLAGLPDSSISVQKLDFNDETDSGEWVTRTSGSIDWFVSISDAQRIACTDEAAHHNTVFSIQFEEQAPADRITASIREFVHQHCTQ